MFIKAVEGRTIRNPVNGAVVGSDAIEVDDNNMFWVRRVRDGDVEIVDQSVDDQSPSADEAHGEEDA